MSEVAQVPQSYESEFAIVGACCVDPMSTVVTSALLQSVDFYWASLRTVYDSVLGVLSEGKPATRPEVYERLKRRGELERLPGNLLDDLYEVDVLRESQLESLCGIIADYSALRRMIHVCRMGITEATTSDRPVKEIIDQVEAEIMSVQSDERSFSTSARARDLIAETMAKIDSYDGKAIVGVNTGFHQFDEMTSGLKGGDLVIVAGRPSMGKTAFAMNVAMNAGSHRQIDGQVAIFSLEMSADALMDRLLAAEARVNQRRWREKTMTREEVIRVARGAEVIGESAIWIDDQPAQTVLDIRAKCRRLSSSVAGLKLVVIDYLQLLKPVSGSDRSREQEVAQMSLSLKALARELDIPVVCLSQLSRSPEQRSDKRPLLSDLRESGAIEQDADMVCFLFRPEYYFPDDPKFKRVAELIIAKQRNGPTGRIPLVWQKDYTRFDSGGQTKDGPGDHRATSPGAPFDQSDVRPRQETNSEGAFWGVDEESHAHRIR